MRLAPYNRKTVNRIRTRAFSSDSWIPGRHRRGEQATISYADGLGSYQGVLKNKTTAAQQSITFATGTLVLFFPFHHHMTTAIMAPSVEILSPVPVPIQHSAEPYYSQGLRQRYHLDAQRPSSIETSTENYADINHIADKAKYLARAEARVRAGGLETELPVGWPKAVEGPLLWCGQDFKDDSEYVYHLTDANKAEIAAALSYFNEQDMNGEEVDQDSFPLPQLGQVLQALRDDIYEGRGFVIVRGLNPEMYSAEDFTVVYLGITSYIAERRGKQDQRGSFLMHIIKKGLDSVAAESYSSDRPFHNDTVCDVLCLVTRSCAASGGQSILASSWKVYNELAATRPDLVHTLAKPDWPFDTYGREPAYYRRAILYHHDGKIIFNFSRRLLVGHPPTSTRTKGIPGLTEAQAEALDAVHFIARKYEIGTSMITGDIRLVNNMGIFHRREAFENDDKTERHLIRVWLNNEVMCWNLPEPLRVAWARVFEDSERGEHWDIVPPRKKGVLLRVAGSCD